MTGHEIIGVISDVGKSVKKFKPGDRVGWGVFADNCDECEICTEGHPEVCLSRKTTYSPIFGGYNTHY